MSYTKTTWNDLTAPAIDATNLNKIEQGIYDNSIDITSINTLIGSSGTATTTQTDYTEGQLTQKLGLKYIKMKGQTSQASDPTPTNPVDVNVVTGSNVIKISNKNLTDGKFRQGGWNGIGTTRLFTTQNYPIKSGVTYTLSTTLNTSTFKYAVQLGSLPYPQSTSPTFYDSTWKTSSSWTFTPSQDGYFGIIVAKSNGTDDLTPSDIASATWQLEVGSTATSYTAHREEDYYLDLSSINLIDISNTTKYPSDTTSGVTVTNNGDGSLTLDGTATAKVNYFITSNPKTYFESEFGAYTYKCFGLPATCNSYISYGGQPTGENIQTYNINAAGRNYSIRIEIPSGVTVTNVRIKPMLVKGTYTATTYPNYEANVYNIELCKIGNYQDYIYKNNGKWYKYGAIGKKTFNGTETWTKGSDTSSNYYIISNAIKSTGNYADGLSNYFINAKAYPSGSTGKFAIRDNGTSLMFNSSETSVENWKTWLTTHNTSIYYPLATPIEEEITYEPLLRQLDKLDKIGLYDISNISQDNSDMKMLLDFTICNDNYNGLREFIRA